MRWVRESVPSEGYTRSALLEWLDRSFRKLSDWTTTAQSHFEGYGGVELSAPLVTSISVTTTAQKLTVFDQGATTNPEDVTQDLANDRIIINAPGIWVGLLKLSGRVTSSSANTNRTFVANLYNENTSSLLDAPFFSPVPRYGETVGVGVTTLLEVTAATVGIPISVYVYTLGSTIQLTQIDVIELSAFRVGLL